MNRTCRRRYYTNNNLPENAIENSCDCVDNSDMFADEQNECDCGFEEEDMIFPMCPDFGQSYVPIQMLNKTFTPEVGLRMGTIFPELVFPYEPCQSMEEINYIMERNEIKGGCNDE